MSDSDPSFGDTPPHANASASGAFTCGSDVSRASSVSTAWRPDSKHSIDPSADGTSGPHHSLSAYVPSTAGAAATAAGTLLLTENPVVRTVVTAGALGTIICRGVLAVQQGLDERSRQVWPKPDN